MTMIDEEEENIEKLLKRKISWKNLLKGILGFILLGCAFLLITLAQQGEEVNTTYFMFGIVLICLGSSIMMPNRKKKKELRHTISILQCEECGNKRVQDYRDGDFVFKKTDSQCEKCKNQFKIIEVNSVKLKTGTKTKNK